MKIVNVYNGDFLNSSQGGGLRYLRDLMRTQREKGFDIELLAVGTASPQHVTLDGIHMRYTPVCNTINWPRFLWGLSIYLLKNRRRLHGTIFHLHRVYFAVPVRLLIRNALIVVTIHTKTFSVLTTRYPLAEKILPLLLLIENILLRTCVDRVSAAGEYAVKLYRERHRMDEASIVPLCGPSLLRAGDRIDPLLAGDPRRTVLCVGRLASVKRPMSVIELFRQAIALRPGLVGTHRLVLVGDGEDREQVEGYVASHGLTEHVIVAGSVHSDRMPDIYAAGCCLVLLSTSETGPFTVKEALASGLPVFATDVGNVSSYVPAECGVVIPVEAPESHAETFLDFLDREYDRNDCIRQAEAIFAHEQAQFEHGLDLLYTREGTA